MRKLSAYGPSLIVLATAMLVLFAGPSAVQRLTYEQTRTQIHQARHNLQQSSILGELNQAYRDIARVVEPSVVHISTQTIIRNSFGRPTIAVSSGSGWIFDDQGHIVTNLHVVENTERIEVQLHDGDLRPAELIGYDQFTDIAVLKIPAERVHAAVCALPNQVVQQGDLVFAFGSPFDFRFSMSSGIVSGQGRSVGVIRDETGRQRGYENFIQVDAAINPGNSGGPLTDYRGHVIGMNTAIATRSGNPALDEGQFAGIGLAIPIQMIYPVVTQLIETGEVTKGYLGVRAEDLDAGLVTALRRRGFIGRGVYVTLVFPDGPARKADIREEDIITHVNDREVESMDQLRSTISSMMPGELAQLTIWRIAPEPSDTGSTITVTVELERLPVAQTSSRPPLGNSGQEILQLGIARMATSTPELAENYDVAFQHGVLLEQTVPGSRLQRAGFGPGSIIAAVMDRPVTDVKELLIALQQHELQRGINVTIFDSDGQTNNFFLVPE
jgi:serine protease Do